MVIAALGLAQNGTRQPPSFSTGGVVDDEFLTVADIARILKLNQQTVRNWI